VESIGYEILSSSGKKWKQVYDNKKNMRVLYNEWERWITTMGADIKIGDGSKKTFQTVMGSWRENFSQLRRWGRSRMMKRCGGLKVGIHLTGDLVDIVRIFIMVSTGEICQMRVKENRKKKGKTLMGRMKGVYHCLREQKRGFAKQTVMMC
jgi:hypothetical protein